MIAAVLLLLCARCVPKVKRFNWKSPVLAGLFFILLTSILIFYCLYIPLPTIKKPFRIYSTDKRDDLKELLKKAIGQAEESITLYSYSITDKDILSLLKNKDIPVHLYYHEKATPSLKKFEGDLFHLYPIKGRGLMHQKIWIIDQKLLFLGSANLTPSSLKMHDNLMVGLYAPSFAEDLSSEQVEEMSYQIGGINLHYFPLPSQKGLEAVLATLDQAQKRVTLSLFTFTHPLLIEKLLELHRRGVQIDLTLDRTSGQGASRKCREELEKGGIRVKLSQGLQLHHHKWAKIDDKIFILGSANWTKAAFNKNRDFILIITHYN